MLASAIPIPPPCNVRTTRVLLITGVGWKLRLEFEAPVGRWDTGLCCAHHVKHGTLYYGPWLLPMIFTKVGAELALSARIMGKPLRLYSSSQGTE